VAGVVDERPLRGERRRQPVEHLVEPPGQAGDLVVAVHRDALPQVGVADRLGRLGQLPYGPQQATGDEPGYGGGRQEDPGSDGGGDPDAGLDLLPLTPEEVGDDEHTAGGTVEPQRHRQVAHGPGGGRYPAPPPGGE